jgi:DNA-binding CsgD family transcriptional regulator
MLETFGAGEATEAVYRELLVYPQHDLAAMADRLGMGVEDVRRELDVLVHLDLVMPHDEGESWLAVPPDQAIETLIAREHEALTRRLTELEGTRRDVGELVDLFVAGRSLVDATGLFEEIDDVQVVRSRLLQLTQAATDCAWSMLPGDAFTPSATTSSQRSDLALLERGLQVRIIVAETSLSAPHWLDHLRLVADQGGEVRIHPAPPFLCVVVDRAVAAIPRTGSRGATVIHRGDLVAPIVALFEEVWRAGGPFDPDSAAAAVEHVSEARLRQVVTLLAQGHKDESIARRMGVSTRTVRRFISAAIDALHAQGRFQAGVHAERRGWVG